jgi:membrane-bound lytic murein transglycosylase D
LQYNKIVRAYIDVYTLKKRNFVEAMLGLTDYYFPMFEEVLSLYGLPLELKYLSIVESALNPNAVSRAGATGIWQFMYTTAKIYNLEINSFVDERRDPLKSTYAAAEYLSELYSLYGEWSLAIAAYNCGPGNVNKAIRKATGKILSGKFTSISDGNRGYVPSFICALY